MRLLPLLLIAFAVLVSVGALGALLNCFGYGVTEWKGQLYGLNYVYMDLTGNAFDPAREMLSNRFNLSVPACVVHAAVLYLMAALAFVAGTTGIAHRERITESIKATALGAVVPLAIPVFIWQAIRLGLVSKFARENTMTFFGYIALVGGLYAASAWANNNIFTAEPEEMVQEAGMSREEIEALGRQEEISGQDQVTRMVSVSKESAPQETKAVETVDPVEAKIANALRNTPLASAGPVDVTLTFAGAQGEPQGRSFDAVEIDIDTLQPEDARQLGEQLGEQLRNNDAGI